MTSANIAEASLLDLLKHMSLSEVVERKKDLENEKQSLDDRQSLLEKQRDAMLNINKTFRNWLTHLQKVKPGSISNIMTLIQGS